jgi:hypothetical protein
MAHCAHHSLPAQTAALPPGHRYLDALRPKAHHVWQLTRKERGLRMPDKGPGSKGGAKKPKGGKAAATKNGKK